MIRLKIFALVLLLGAGPAWAAHPGFVDLSELEARIDAKPKVSVTLGDWFLKAGGEALADEPELAAMRKLESLQVRVYESADAALGDSMMALADELAGAGWQSVVTVSEETERVRVLMKPEGDNIAGLTVLVHGSGGEAVLLNAYGEIRPQDLGRLISGISDIKGADLARLNADIDYQ